MNALYADFYKIYWITVINAPGSRDKVHTGCRLAHARSLRPPSVDSARLRTVIVREASVDDQARCCMMASRLCRCVDQGCMRWSASAVSCAYMRMKVVDAIVFEMIG